MDRDQVHAFEAFVAASGRRLLRTAVLLSGDEGHAEDLVQTTLERVARRWSRIDGPPEAYARVVLSRLAVDGHRRRSARVREAPLVDEDRAAPEPDVDTRTALLAALRTLPERQRAVLVLRFFDDLPETEIAAVLGVAPGTVKSAGSRGLARLRELVPDLDPAEGA